MVRYSKMEFRSLVRKYGADLTFTPMTIANSFCRSEKARQHEFETNNEDSPLIVQFAANCTTDFLHATQMIAPYVDGVDLNCGCPQKWAKQDGYGSYLLTKPEVIEDMLKTVRRNMPEAFSVSIKIRLLNKNLKSTIDFCRQLEAMNPTFITVHGRTPREKSSSDFPSDVEAVGEIKKSIHIPMLYNGDITNLEDADRVWESTKCDGVMAARGILTNPALFSGYKVTPKSCIQNWINIHHQRRHEMRFYFLHHHLVFMMEHVLEKPERNRFNEFLQTQQDLDFLKQEMNIEPQPINYPQSIQCQYDDSDYKNLINQSGFWDSEYSPESSHGQYFLSKLHRIRKDPDDYLEFMDNGSLFN